MAGKGGGAPLRLVVVASPLLKRKTTAVSVQWSALLDFTGRDILQWR